MMSPGDTGKKSIGEEASESINKKLSGYCEAARQPSIYKVHHQFLRDPNHNAFEPRVVAVGPYHHGKQSLKMMEEHKLRYLKSLLRRKNETADRYISAAAEMEEEARSYYGEKLGLSAAEFVEMLVLDGCFIIELFSKFQSDPNCTSDPIFKMEWILELLRHDLILFENQIPFFVLCKLFELIDEGPNQHWRLIGSFLSFLEMENLCTGIMNVKSEEVRFLLHVRPEEVRHLLHVKLEEVRHLLHLTHAIMRPSPSVFYDLNPCLYLNPCLNQREYRVIPSATELREANVAFHKSRQPPGQPFKVNFHKGKLTMSTLSIGDYTYSFFRNLIFYEQYFPDDQPTYVTDYLVLLDCLVNTVRDVEILSQCGIFEIATGDNQQAADIIIRLTYSVFVSRKNLTYGDTFNKINAH